MSCSLWETIRQGCEIRKILPPFLLASGIQMPEGIRTQIGPDSFLRQLTDPCCSIGNLLIIQGGVRHMDTHSYYVRTACSIAPSNLRIFLYERLTPMVNLNFSHNIADACHHLRKKFEGPLIIVGYSMGGVLLYNYLSLGYDQADLYIPTCCPLDLSAFRRNIDKHALFRLLQKLSYAKFNVENYEELLEFSGTNAREQEDLIQKFIPGLNKYRRQWQPKTLYCISTEDPITQNYEQEIRMLKSSPSLLIIKGGWHCCFDTILLTIQLVIQGCHQITDRGKAYPEKLWPREQDFLRQLWQA